MRVAAEGLSTARAAVTRVGERIGEAGGESLLQQLGYRIPPEFKATVVAGPGSGHLDGIAVNGTSIVVAEFKGVSARLSTTPIQTMFDGPATQGSAAYVREVLLRDPRVAQFFADNPTLWKGLLDGRMTLSSMVIQTRAVDNIVATPLSIDLTPDLIDTLGKTISQLKAGVR